MICKFISIYSPSLCESIMQRGFYDDIIEDLHCFPNHQPVPWYPLPLLMLPPLPQPFPSLPALLILTLLLQPLDYHLTSTMHFTSNWLKMLLILYLVCVQPMSSSQAKWLKLTFSSSPNPAGKEITMNVFEDEVYRYFGKRLRLITAVNEGAPTV